MYLPVRELVHRYQFDAFEVDAGIGELRRDGEKVPVQEIPLRLLVALLENPGAMRTHEQLRKEIWPEDVHLDFDASLRTAAHKLRQALGDDPSAPRYLETIPGRCYRFLAKVSIQEAAVVPTDVPSATGTEPGRPAPRRLLLAGLVPIAGLVVLGLLLGNPWRPAPKRVVTLVALPAQVLGAPQPAFLADAIPGTLTTVLAGVEGLETKAPPGSVEMARLEGDPFRAAELYRVENLLQTMVTVQGERLVLDAKLIHAGTRKVRWAGQFEGSLGGYNDLIRQAATAVAGFLRPSGAGRAELAGPAFGSDAELAFREGQYFLKQYCDIHSPYNFEHALAAFQQAWSRTPSSAQLAAELGFLYQFKCWYDGDAEAGGRAGTWSDQALALDPRCGLAWAVRGWAQVLKPKADLDKVFGCALNAARLNPMDPWVHISLGYLAPTASVQAAAGAHAVELDPLNPVSADCAAMGLIEAGKAEQALAVLERALRIQPGSFRFWRFYALFKLGRTREALEASPEPAAEGWIFMKDILEGKFDAARQRILSRQAKWNAEAARTPALRWHFDAIRIPGLLVRLGQREDAFRTLQRAEAAGAPIYLDTLLRDPDLQPLKGDARFAKILEGSRASARLWLKHAEAADAKGELPAYLRPATAELRELVARNP